MQTSSPKYPLSDISDKISPLIDFKEDSSDSLYIKTTLDFDGIYFFLFYRIVSYEAVSEKVNCS